MTLPESVERAAARLHTARPDDTIILFGSQARGDTGPDSDVDFMVVQPVLVASRRTFNKWSVVPGTICHTAATEGRGLYGIALEGIFRDVRTDDSTQTMHRT